MSYNDLEEYTCSEVFVNFKDFLGSGSFGKVYKGRLNGEDVAVKVIEGENRESIKEIKRMLKASGHDNVLDLLGSVPPHNHSIGTCHKQTRDTTWLVMEYMENGNLSSYIRNFAGGLPAYGMIKIAYQVALGMDHLHRYCNLLHMDLATRNVLVQDDDYNVKIGDFGLCRDYDFSEEYYNGNGFICPVRWMPPENHPFPNHTKKPKFSRKGDVWSFGVLLFELWTRGKTPFEGIHDNYQVMAQVSRGRTVLDYHKVCARSWVIDLMEQCFSFDKADRPNFRKIYSTILDKSEYSVESGTASASDSESECQYHYEWNYDEGCYF